jgi:hypothetical protein
MTTSTSSTTGSAATAQRTDLRDRTSAFAREARSFVRKTPRTLASLGDCRNLIRSTGTLGASYIDADEAGSREEFLRCMGNCKRQARQSTHWLTLLEGDLDERSEDMRSHLIKEAGELERIFGAIVGKVLAKARQTREAAAK